jgi:hypothetical protein
MQTSQEEHINNVVQSIRRRIETRLLRVTAIGQKLDPDTVEAIDVVHHALTFIRHPRGLELWRRALWGKELDPQAEAALREMLVYLLAAVERGELEAVNRICDCLHEILPAGHELQATLSTTVSV